MMGELKNRIRYYLWATYRRKILDRLLEVNKHYYQGVVLDIGGRDRGKFKKPKQEVGKWIFADIEEKRSPDIVLNVCNMEQIQNESIDVINATELFEHVENPEKGLKECYRVLKRGGVMILSSPFLYPIHGDPHDLQRWTEEKWKKELQNLGFRIEKFEIMGKYFTVLADFIRVFFKSVTKPLRYFSYIFCPLLDAFRRLDEFDFIRNHPKLGKLHGGYFIITRK